MVRKRVFILTPSSGFGSLIREVLEDTGAYQPFLFPRPKDALELARKDAVALIVLDAELGAQASPQLLAEFRGQAPHARLVITPAEGNPYDPQIRLLRADAILPSPFYLPDLIAAIEQFFGPIVPRDSPRRSTYGEKAAFVPAPIREKARAPDWLEDVSEAAGYLTRLSLESASRAALITKGDKAWAYAGELPTQAADELAAAVAEHTANGNEDDLARFIHLNATGIDYMLYATGLGGDFTLALVFDAQIPFSQMRARVNDLAKALVTAPLEMRNESNTAVQSVGREAGLRLPVEKGAPPASPSRANAQPERPEPTVTPSLPQPSDVPQGPSPGGEDLHYSFVIIPRLPKHRLEGDLADMLAERLPELCLAFAWRLERISVQADFLQWTISMPPGGSPESVVQELDKHLSGRIFYDFPRLARDNPSGRFWAPGYLVVGGRPPSPGQISEFIQSTRARQGVPR